MASFGQLLQLLSEEVQLSLKFREVSIPKKIEFIKEVKIQKLFIFYLEFSPPVHRLLQLLL